MSFVSLNLLMADCSGPGLISLLIVVGTTERHSFGVLYYAFSIFGYAAYGTDGLDELIDLFKHVSLGAVHAVLNKSDRKRAIVELSMD